MIPLEYLIAIHQYDAAVSDWITGGQIMTQNLSERLLYWRKIVGKYWYSTDEELDNAKEVC